MKNLYWGSRSYMGGTSDFDELEEKYEGLIDRYEDREM